jgi:hypothetical protein
MSSASQDLDDVSDDELPGSSSKAASMPGRVSSTSGGSGQHTARGSSNSEAQLSSWSYVYVPGAGDDEESWAAGLTPGLFWDNCEALLSCGPAGIGAAVKQLLAHHRSLAYGRGSSSISQQLLQLVPHRVCGSPTAHGVHSDRHHPAPKGCGGGAVADGLYAEAAAAGLKVVCAAPGVFWLGSTGLALGNLEGATAADVWRTVDAVLCCGTAMSPALQHEYQLMQLRVERKPAMPGACEAGAVCGSAPGGVSGAGLAAGLCFKPTYCWHGSSHVLEQISSSYSSCSEWAHQHRPQQQQEELASAAAAATGNGGGNSSPPAASAADASEIDNLTISKLDVPAAAKQVKRKGGMLTELLSKSKPAQQQPQQQHCAAAQAQQANRRQAGRSRSQHAHTSSIDSVGSIGSCGVAASESSASSSDSNCSSAFYSTSSDDHAAAPAGGCGQQPQLQRLKWLPVECAKRDRSSLKQHLQDALEFVSAHLAAGHSVLLHDVEGECSITATLRWMAACHLSTLALLIQVCLCWIKALLSKEQHWPQSSGLLLLLLVACVRTLCCCSLPHLMFSVLLHAGHDNCVCMAVALLLACFTPPDTAAAAAGASAAPADCGPHFLSGWTAAQQQQQLPPEPVSKHSVRQRLALVSSCYPAARPTRGSLKQVFNFFEERRRAGSGGSSSTAGCARKGVAGSRSARPPAPSEIALN